MGASRNEWSFTFWLYTFRACVDENVTRKMLGGIVNTTGDGDLVMETIIEQSVLLCIDTIFQVL